MRPSDENERTLKTGLFTREASLFIARALDLDPLSRLSLALDGDASRVMFSHLTGEVELEKKLFSTFAVDFYIRLSREDVAQAVENAAKLESWPEEAWCIAGVLRGVSLKKLEKKHGASLVERCTGTPPLCNPFIASSVALIDAQIDKIYSTRYSMWARSQIQSNKDLELRLKVLLNEKQKLLESQLRSCHLDGAKLVYDS